MVGHFPLPEEEHMQHLAENDESPHPLLRRNTGLAYHQLKRFNAELPENSKQVWSRWSRLEDFDVQRHTDEEIKENRERAKLQRRDWFEQSFVFHTECGLGRSMYNADNLSAYQSTSRSLRDLLVVDWQNTQQQQALENAKRVYYFSFEFLMGRALDNALFNKGVRKIVDDSLVDLGFRLEDVFEEEADAGLGNGGLGRLAACFVDSLSTRRYSGWGYSLNYRYGIFRQSIVDGYQVEQPDNWLQNGSTWEVDRNEIQIPVTLYGHVESRWDPNTGAERRLWVGGQKVIAVPTDFPVPGFQTENCNNLRLFNAKPTQAFDFSKFNSGNYSSAVSSLQDAEAITAVLYPNDNFDSGKELRLKQQYFWVAAALYDIVRRFQKFGQEWKEFPNYVAIQLNDTHPTMAVVELMRLLIDEHNLPWEMASFIVEKTFAYTNHTVMQEALEKWPVSLIERMLPRHLEIIYEINWRFLEHVSQKFPGDNDLRTACSIIEEGPIKYVRMGYLAVIATHRVNGVAELHSKLVKTELFPQFVRVFGEEKFTNVTNGITPRRWLGVANPLLTSLISETLKDPELNFLKQLTDLKKLEASVDDDEFLERWDAVKIRNKHRVANLVEATTGVKLDPKLMFDIQVKRIHEYKRQQMNIFAVIWRYLQIKNLLAKGKRPKDITADYFVPKACIIGGKAAPGYDMAKTIIHLVNAVASVVNADTEVASLLRVVFVPDYNVSKAEVLVAGSDISNHISTAGTEASGTSNMKFALNGGLILGTVDGANIEIEREVGKENIFTFGVLAENVPGIIKENRKGVAIPSSLLEVFNAIDSGVFGPPADFRPLLDSIRYHGDYYIVASDFELFLEAHKEVEAAYGRGHGDPQHLHTWVKKCVRCVANMGFFSSDRAVDEYARKIWDIKEQSTKY